MVYQRPLAWRCAGREATANASLPLGPCPLRQHELLLQVHDDTDGVGVPSANLESYLIANGAMRRIPGTLSKSESTLTILVMPFLSIVAACTASRTLSPE